MYSLHTCNRNADGCVYDLTAYGVADCDAAWDQYWTPCSVLETNYGWDCTGCECSGDSCFDTDGTATDTHGYGCPIYYGYESYCGQFDDSDFIAMEMCCACGGGQVGTSPGTSFSHCIIFSLPYFVDYVCFDNLSGNHTNYYVGEGLCREWDCADSCESNFDVVTFSAATFARCEAACAAANDCKGFGYSNYANGRCTIYSSAFDIHVGGTTSDSHSQYWSCYSKTPPPNRCASSCTAAYEKYGQRQQRPGRARSYRDMGSRQHKHRAKVYIAQSGPSFGTTAQAAQRPPAAHTHAPARPPPPTPTPPKKENKNRIACNPPEMDLAQITTTTTSRNAQYQ